MKLNVIFPCHPLNKKAVDPEFSGEYHAVQILGGNVRLFDFDLLKSVTEDDVTEDFGFLVFPDQRVPDNGDKWIYRGWMMTPYQYETFIHACKDVLSITIINTASQYNICHLYPLVYPYLKEHAIDTYVQELYDSNGHSKNVFDYKEMYAYFDAKYHYANDRRVMVKDWVKSAKDSPDSVFIQDYEDEAEVMKVVSNMIKARGKLFNTGYVFKKTVDFDLRSDGKPNEWRAFFVYDKLVSFKPTHGLGGPDLSPPQWLIDIAKTVPSDFYTIDVGVLAASKDVVIIEAGDGGVSGLSPDQLPVTFYSSLMSMLEPH